MQETINIPKVARKTALIAGFACLAILCTGSNAFGSLMYKLSPTEMTQMAKEVRMGEVVSTWSSPDPANKMIYTYVKIRVDQTFKGQARSEVLLRQPGGTYTHENGQTYRQKVFGMNSFEKGQKGIFFIEHTKDGAPSVMLQGVHKIMQDPSSGEPQAHHSYSKDVEYLDRNLRSVKASNAFFEDAKVRKLDDLIQEIETASASEKGRSMQQ